MLGTGLLLGKALQKSWDRPALGTGPPKFRGQNRSWDRPFKNLGGVQAWPGGIDRRQGVHFRLGGEQSHLEAGSGEV